MDNRQLSFLTPALLLLLMLLVACSDNRQSPAAVDVPEKLLEREDAIGAGKVLFVRHCRECHGTSSEGKTLRATMFNPPAPDFLTYDYMQADPAYLYWRIREGKTVEPFYSQGSVMPAFGPHFSALQTWQLVAYLKRRAGGANR